MKDRYLKAVLTVIAGALVVIAAESAIPAAHAQFGATQKVQICDDLHCADMTPVILGTAGGRPVTSWALSVAQESKPK
jgi:hypothetical protein